MTIEIKAQSRRVHLEVALDLLETAKIHVENAADELEVSWRAGEGIDGDQREQLLQLCSGIGDDVGNLPGFVSQEDSP